ncbi:GNAT family protein [uncultured Bosea sp.]|uniref:GNAT family N-acetyltransferase n=1 Tax=uncultured Bosea sp. TaxID=211457 RepID=UPI002600369A|nr:GNAT family protein [uncultured Bosea sp.]
MPKKPVPHPVLSTPRLRLRQFRTDDVDAMHACFADPDAMRFWNTPVHTRLIETERSVRNFIDCTPSYYRFWAVADAETDRCLGLVNYHDGHIRSRRASIGYIIDPEHHRQGIAMEAVTAMLDFCFGELGLHRLQAFIHPENQASLRLIEKLGFRREGLLRDHLRVGEDWRDDALYALLTAEWRSPVQRGQR